MISFDQIDPNFLNLAFTHRSFLNENKQAKEHNERLEFLGDAVLELATSKFLYDKFPNTPEGELTAYRSALVKTTTLADVATKLNFGTMLKMSRGEEQTGGRSNPSLLADTFEAFIGALYLSNGYEAVVVFLTEVLFPNISQVIEQKLFKDFKSSLQEKVQSQGSASPEYEVFSESGPDHNKTFIVAVKINGQEFAQGQGKSKQEAQQQAAKHALEKLSLS